MITRSDDRDHRFRAIVISCSGIVTIFVTFNDMALSLFGMFGADLTRNPSGAQGAAVLGRGAGLHSRGERQLW
jgi:hypothetical protein